MIGGHQGCGTPDNDNAEIQSSLWARDSSKPKQQTLLSDLTGEVFSATSDHLESVVFKGFIFFLLFLLTETI
jgi:hypothetical protein